MRIKHIGFFLNDSIFDAERVMDDLVGYCEMEHTKQGTIYHLQIVVDGEIVRCKDCKHKCVKGKTTRYHYCEIWKSAVDETDFCSRGEKR